MKNVDETNSQGASPSVSPPAAGFFPWQLLKQKRIAYLTLPLLVMATVTEFVILATGWKYQKMVCLPKGMGVTFFGIGPIGATILAVEMLKLPLAIWTASRQGWQKFVMLAFGLPLICLLTFQLVKDMAVYEMGVALTPASQFLEQAMNQEVAMAQLSGELAAIEQKKADSQKRLAELAARDAKGKTDLEEALKLNDDLRHDAVSLTDYQKKELSEVDTRQSAIIKQFDADAAQISREIADLRANRETEVARASRWNAEEARIDNDYKAKMVDYENRKAAYEKENASYLSANPLKRAFMTKPLDPGVPPARESNTILKPAAIAEIDDQIKAKEAELTEVNNRRRARVAEVEDNARRMREEFSQRSSTKREETDHKREELLASQAALAAQLRAEESQVDQEYASAAQKVDGIRAEQDACRKKAEEFYAARETSIKSTQVHRIATTVEILRGLLTGQHPITIKATAKERGDLYTDQISMVRIWVYPVLAFIVAFLPTLLVEIGFSTIFQPEKQRPPHRLGFFGRRLHWLYIRAGRQKILRAERLTSEAAGQIAIREKALADAKTSSDLALAEKEAALQSARNALRAAAATHVEELERIEQEHAAETKTKGDEWAAQLAGMADALNRTVLEKDALRDLQKSEVERQIQMRQQAWSDRLAQMRQELDEQRASFEAERTALMQAQHKKLMDVTEDCKTQVAQARRQAADAELAALDATARLSNDLKEALRARNSAESQLQHQAESFALKVGQAKEDAAREVEKATRQEKHRLERQQLEFAKTLRQKEEDFEHQLKQREQELSLGFNARLTEEQTRFEQAARRQRAELERQFETRATEVQARWKQESAQREEAAQIRLAQRETQLQAQAEGRLGEAQTEAQQELLRQEMEWKRKLEAQAREADTRSQEELQRKELAFQAKLKQRDQEWAIKSDARLAELQNQWNSDLQARKEELERQADARVRAVEARLAHEAQQQEEKFLAKSCQSDQQWQTKLDALRHELQAQNEDVIRRRDAEAEAVRRELEARLRNEMQQSEAGFHGRLKQREQELAAKAEARETELQNQWASDLRTRKEEWERHAEARVRAVEARLGREAEEKEEVFQLQSRQSDQQWHERLDALRRELQAQNEDVIRRRDAEVDVVRRELEARLRKEMQQNELAFQARLKQREQDVVLQLTAQAEARHIAAQAQWETESEKKARAAAEPYKTLLVRAEKERDEARQSASESSHQVQQLEKKLTEASSFLNGWRNGKSLAEAA